MSMEKLKLLWLACLIVVLAKIIREKLSFNFSK